MTNPKSPNVVNLHQKIDQFIDDLRTDCEHWYLYINSLDNTQHGLTQYIAGLKYARISYNNRAARIFRDSFSTKIEQRIEKLLQAAELQAKHQWPNL